MQHFEKPEIMVLEGKDAVEVLNNYIQELKENSVKELTENQTRAMIKISEELIQTIQNGTPIQENARKAPLLTKITEMAKKLISREPAHEFILAPVIPQISIPPPNDK